MKDIIRLVMSQDPDLVIHTKDGDQVLGHSVLVSLHSPLIAEMLSGAQHRGRLGITVDATTEKVREVVKLIEENNKDLQVGLENNEVAKLLGIRYENWTWTRKVKMEFPQDLINDDQGKLVEETSRYIKKETPQQSKKKKSVKKRNKNRKEETEVVKESGKNCKVDRQCEKCPEVFNKIEVFENHVKAHELYTVEGEEVDENMLEVDLRDGMVLKCDPCEIIYSSAYLFKKHMKSFHKDGYSCETCSNLFTFKHMLFRHVLESHTIFPNQCRYCKEDKFNAKDFIDHARKHLSKKTNTELPCDICGKILADKYKLKAHMKRRHENESCTCEDCGQIVTSTEKLKSHRKIKHPEEGSSNLFSCAVCKKGYLKKGAKNICEDKHMGIFKYQCTYCNFKTIASYKLKDHMNTHTKEIVYVCPVCEIKTDSLKKLTLHVKQKHGKTLCEAETNFKRNRYGVVV